MATPWYTIKTKVVKPQFHSYHPQVISIGGDMSDLLLVSCLAALVGDLSLSHRFAVF